MPLFINTNIPSLSVQRHMASGTSDLNKVFARLSSGLRINTAGDDAAGLGITNRMTAQIRGLTQAIRNANDGISVVQVAEGALSEDSNMLQRISELSVQAANATNSDADRQSLQDEVGQLLDEIERVAQETEFNGWPMLNGETLPLKFQVGAKEGQTITVELADARASTLLSQPVLANPNGPQSLTNPKIEGMTISAPDPALQGSKLYASGQSAMINAVASADVAGVSPATLKKDDVVTNMSLVAGVSDEVAETVKVATEEAVTSSNVQSIEGLETVPSVTEVVETLGGSATAVIDGIALGKDYMAIARSMNEIEDSELPSVEDRIAAAAGLAAAGLSTDGVTKIAGGGNRENVISTVIAMESLVTKDAAFENDKDKARVLAAAMYAANRSYTSEPPEGPGADSVPDKFTTLAGSVNGAIAQAGFDEETGDFDETNTANVVDNAVKIGTLVKDVPVGNILAVILAFDRAINEGRNVDTAAREATVADRGGDLTMDEAKIIMAAGLIAAKQGNTVTMAKEAAVDMALVLAARDAAAAAAAAPKGGEKITVPTWMLNTQGQNRYPPVPLIDITGKTIPSDPTLEFDPPNTDAGGTKPYNPPLDGQAAASRMLSLVLGGIDRVSSTRGELGAIQGRFTSNIANLSNVVENVSAARSRIMDADIAAETANLTKLTILQQAGTAILAQANQLPQLALQLLQ